ncbi:E3 ubiquitin-protein ligase TRIM32-like [Branchiostoma floridae x Branchiostoma belcheri]
MSRQDVGRFFIFIKNRVSSDWKDLAWCLGFETPDIKNIIGKEHDDKSRCLELLQEWHKRKGNAATIHVLMEALQEAELQLVVDSLKDKYPELKEKPNSSKQLLTAKQPMEGACGSQQKHPVQTMSDQHSMDKPTALDTGQVKQSVVQPERKVKGTSVRPIRVGQPWVRKVRFGGWGSGRGEFKGPFGVAVSQDNEVYVADRWNSRIQVFTMDGVYIREFTTTLPGETGETLSPHDVAVDRNDNLWVVGGAHVVQYSREGTCLTTIDLPYGKYIRGITVSMATEQVIVTEYDDQNGRLQVFNQDGSKVGTYGSGHRSPRPWWPCYVTVDGEGNILVTDGNNHCVHVLDREGNFKFKFGSEGSDESQLKNPQGICVDGKGNIIVADSGNGCVKMFDSQGRFLCYIGSGMEDPWAFIVSPGGDVVVTEYYDNTVSVWTQG